jgi:TrmH family RNA methyltransferase
MNHDGEITSLKNDRVKDLVRLRTRRERDRQGLTIIEEPLVITRALDAGYPMTTLFFCPEQVADTELLERLGKVANLERILVTAPVMDKISYREQGAGLLVVAPQMVMGLADLKLPSDALVVVLENVEKPGNLGAVLRVADGAGAHALLSCGGGTDLFNPNVLRASRGAFFSVPTVAGETGDILDFCRTHGLKTIATSPTATESWDTTDLTGGTAILLGAEDTGLTPELLVAVDTTVSVPMAGSGDSLNVATTAAVMLYEAVRQYRALTLKED